jgi:diadenosine tetraphosphate (Ap4A) HIT family hydrolase
MIDFSKISEEIKIHTREYLCLNKDGYPVSPGHRLIISKGIKKNIFLIS